MTASRGRAWNAGAAGPALRLARDDDDPFDVLRAMLAEDGELEWQERALCAQADPDRWFPEKGGSTREAKRVCASCEVRPECLGHALDHGEKFGIWGGLSERERRRLKRQAA